MDKIVTKVNGLKFVTNESALDELDTNNCTMPNVKRIIYNVGAKAYLKRDGNGKVLKDESGKVVYDQEVPVLATVVYFVDGTKVSVVNSQNDGVQFEDHVLSDGQTVKVATKESKERGLIYAVVKRLVSVPDRTGKMVESGLGRILNELVDGAYDTAIASREAKIAQAKAKAKYEATKGTASKKVKYSIAGTLERINKILDKVEGGDPAAADVLNKVVSAFKD